MNWPVFAALLLGLILMLHPGGLPSIIEGQRRLPFAKGPSRAPAATPHPLRPTPLAYGSPQVQHGTPASSAASQTRVAREEVVIAHFPFRIGSGPRDDLRISSPLIPDTVAQIEPLEQRLVLRVLKSGTAVHVTYSGRDDQWRPVNSSNAIKPGSRISLDGHVLEVRAAPWRVVRCQ